MLTSSGGDVRRRGPGARAPRPAGAGRGVPACGRPPPRAPSACAPRAASAGRSPPIPKRSSITWRAFGSRRSSALRIDSSSSSTATSSSGEGPSEGSIEPSSVSPSEPTGVSRRHRHPLGGAQLLDLSRVHVEPLGQLLGRRLAPELAGQLALGVRILRELLADVHRDADRARVVLEPALHRLADPPGRVGRELEAAAVVELLDRPDQAEDALLDQVEERQPEPAVALGVRDHQPQVGLDHPVLGLLVAALDALCQLDLLGGGQQRPLARCRAGTAGASRRASANMSGE